MKTNKLFEVKTLHTKISSKDKTSYVMNDANIIINKGTSVGIVGESGSGKTQFLKTISGTQEMTPGITNGSVTFYLNNKKITMYDKVNGNFKLNKNNKIIKKDVIGFIPQDPKSFLNPYWSIKQLFKETYNLKKNNFNNLNDFIYEYLSLSGISEIDTIKDKKPHQLSGGQAQRIMIALILSKNPDLIIADEISTGVDVSRQKILIESFKKIKIKKPDLTIIFISHDFGFLSHLVDEYYVLYGGFICEHITDKNQFKNQQKLHPYTKDLIMSIISKNTISNHDNFSSSLLDKPIKYCPYYNIKCTKQNCSNKDHFHDSIPPIFNEKGKSENINLSSNWKRSK